MRTLNEYAVYKGEEVLAIGTVKECAETLGVRPETILFYGTPCYERRIAKRKRADNYRVTVKLD